MILQRYQYTDMQIWLRILTNTMLCHKGLLLLRMDKKKYVGGFAEDLKGCKLKWTLTCLQNSEAVQF